MTDRQTIKELWGEGKDTYDIAKAIGKRESWVYNSIYVEKMNILVPSVPKPKKLIKYVGYNNPGKPSCRG